MYYVLRAALYTTRPTAIKKNIIHFGDLHKTDGLFHMNTDEYWSFVIFPNSETCLHNQDEMSPNPGL